MDVLNYRFYTPIAFLRQLLVYNIESKAFGISILIQNASNSFVYFQQNFVFSKSGKQAFFILKFSIFISRVAKKVIGLDF